MKRHRTEDSSKEAKERECFKKERELDPGSQVCREVKEDKP